MGSSVSTGRDNDELIDNLIHAEYIQSSNVEKVFRAVDRADYYLANDRCGAYRDVAWKSGNLHLSAPCVYSKVMEGLELREGLSFLNIGSGTGYLSTMVGLILGTYGINHGIEIHKDVIDYAYEKLDYFKSHSPALDENDFTEPKFIHGNGVCFANDSGLYDRAYCGARCPEYAIDYIKRLIKVGGILVAPVNDLLLQYERTGDETWEVKTLLSVSFAPLIMPQSAEEYSTHTIDMITSEPINLQAACRAVIRTILRKNIELENPEIKTRTRKPIKRPREKREQLDLLPMFDLHEDLFNPIRSKRRRSFLNRIYNLVESASNDDTTTNEEEEDDDSDSDGHEESNNNETVEENNKTTENQNINLNNGQCNIDDNEHSSDTDNNDAGHSSSSSSSSSSSNFESENTSDSDSDESDKELSSRLIRINKIKHALDTLVFDSDTDAIGDSKDAVEEEPRPPYVSPYTVHMRTKIQALPLPPALKIYVNYYRSFE